MEIDMTLTNYWWLLIWIFVGGWIFSMVPKQQEIVNGKIEERWQMIAAVGLALPYIIWTGFRVDSFGDTGAYRKIFQGVSDITQMSEYLAENTKDKGFSVLMMIMKSIIGNRDVVFFLIIAIFQLGCIIYVYRKFSSDYWISLLLFILSTDYLSWMHNGMRQFIAVTMIFACTSLILKNKYVSVIGIILLASTIHGTALIMIPILFIVHGKAWNKKCLFFLLCGGIAILFIDRFTPIMNSLLADTQYSDLMTNETWATDDGTSIIRVLVYSVPALLAIVGKKYIDQANDPFVDFCVNCSMVTMVLYFIASVSSGIYVGRLPIYTSMYGYILMPWLINHMFNRESAKLVRVLMIGAYCMFYYYQMHIAWGAM